MSVSGSVTRLAVMFCAAVLVLSGGSIFGPSAAMAGVRDSASGPDRTREASGKNPISERDDAGVDVTDIIGNLGEEPRPGPDLDQAPPFGQVGPEVSDSEDSSGRGEAINPVPFGGGRKVKAGGRAGSAR